MDQEKSPHIDFRTTEDPFFNILDHHTFYRKSLHICRGRSFWKIAIIEEHEKPEFIPDYRKSLHMSRENAY